MQRLVMHLALMSAVLLAPTLSADADERRPSRAEKRVRQQHQRRIVPSAHRFQHLEGVYPVRVSEARLRNLFEEAVTVVVEMQARQISEGARLDRDLGKKRTQRRSPHGALDLQDIEPSHIPSLEVARIPL